MGGPVGQLALVDRLVQLHVWVEQGVGHTLPWPLIWSQLDNGMVTKPSPQIVYSD